MGPRPNSHDLAHRLQRLVLRLNRALRAQNAGASTSNADAVLLAEIRHAPGLGVSELAAMENVARSVMSERLKRLAAAGLVRLVPAPHDRRRVGATITAAGRAILKDITAKRRSWMAGRLGALSMKERNAVEAAVDALERTIEQRSTKGVVVDIGERKHVAIERRRARPA